MITERNHEKRLKKFDINIKTKYKTADNILERNTDGSLNNNISEGVRIRKDYYHKGQLIHRETTFDSRIIYSFEFNKDNEIQTCPNCGKKGTIKEFTNGCPYCRTHYNIDYDNKNLGTKHYYDLVIKGKGYIVKTLIIDLIISLIISLIFIIQTSRTFTIFDISKVFIGTILIGTILFYLFYYLDAAIVLPFVRKKKEKINNTQVEFWERMNKYKITKLPFYNNLNYNLRCLYYSDKYKNIIDYDILDYNYLKESESNNDFYITVNLDIRIIRYIDGKIKSKIENQTYTLKRVKIDKLLNKGVNVIKCHNCSNSIDITKGICEYCRTEFNYLQEWYLIENKD